MMARSLVPHLVCVGGAWLEPGVGRGRTVPVEGACRKHWGRRGRGGAETAFQVLSRPVGRSQDDGQ